MKHPALERSIGSHEGRRSLFAQRCRQCATAYFPVGNTCAACGSVELDRVPLSASGSVFSWTAIHRAASGWKVPYIVALVDFPEGPRIFGQVQAELDAMRAGLPVDLAFGTPPAGQPADAYYFVAAEQ